jgi:hypothetical protein
LIERLDLNGEWRQYYYYYVIPNPNVHLCIVLST